jgi:hypothetical protein
MPGRNRLVSVVQRRASPRAIARSFIVALPAPFVAAAVPGISAGFP